MNHSGSELFMAGSWFVETNAVIPGHKLDSPITSGFSGSPTTSARNFVSLSIDEHDEIRCTLSGIVVGGK